MVEAKPDNVIVITKEEEFDQAIKETKVVIADFNAVWCPPCKKLKPILFSVAKSNPDIKVLDIDVDNNKPLSAKYKISSIPVMKLYVDGKQVDECVGLDVNFLKENVKKHYPEFKFEK